MSKPVSGLETIKELVQLGYKCHRADRENLAKKFFDRAEEIMDLRTDVREVWQKDSSMDTNKR